MLSINEKINYEDKGEFLVISLNEDGFMLEDKTSIFIFHRIEAKKFKNIDEAVSRLS
ncbi:reticulocalbin-1, partial [Enterococcus faecalis]|nr:reticulocalbin-1 [Enterococcus faecalis]